MRTIILIILSAFLISCSSQNKHQKPSSAFLEINFGSGGGFTGLSSNYTLKANQDVFKQSGGELSKINQISKKDARNISKTIREIDFFNLNLSDKGNMTYFIEVKSDGSVNKVSWTDSSQSPEIKEFYKTLVSTTLKQK
jgi:hypothetical protein